MAFCRALGAEPYFAANLGSSAPQEMRDWIEYANFAGHSTLADERRANGAAEPFGIKHWGIGNENWGCGGQHDAGRIRRRLRPLPLVRLLLPRRPRWTPSPAAPTAPTGTGAERLLETLGQGRRGMMQGFAAHYYCGDGGHGDRVHGRPVAGAARQGRRHGGHRHRATGPSWTSTTRSAKYKLIVDEWGTWHPVEPGKPGGRPVPAEHDPRRLRGRADAGRVPQPRRQSLHGEHRPDHQRLAGPAPGGGRQVHHDPDLPRL